MSIRLSERYQTIKLKNGSNVYRIYNLDIISRLTDSPINIDSCLHSLKEEQCANRCAYRVLSFVDPQPHFLSAGTIAPTAGQHLQQQPQNLQKYQEMSQHDEFSQSNGNSSKYSFKKQKSPSQYQHLRGKQASTSTHYNELSQQSLQPQQHQQALLHLNHFQESTHQSMQSHSPMSINKKISKAATSKFLEKQRKLSQRSMHPQEDTVAGNSSNNQSSPMSTRLCYPPPPPFDSTTSQGTSTEIMISSMNRTQDSNLIHKPCRKMTAQEQDNHDLQFRKNLSVSSLTHPNVKNQLLMQGYQSNIQKQEDGEDKVSIDMDIEANHEDQIKYKKFRPTGSSTQTSSKNNQELYHPANLLNGSSSIIKFENQNHKIPSNVNNNSKSIQAPNMLWTFDQDNRTTMLIKNKQHQISGRVKQNSFGAGTSVTPGEFFAVQSGIKIPILRNENQIENENKANHNILKISSNSISNTSSTNNNIGNNSSSSSTTTVSNSHIVNSSNTNTQSVLMVKNNNNLDVQRGAQQQQTNIHNSELFKQLSMEYKMIPKNNTLKNIKKAFIRYLLKTSRKQLIKKCEQYNLEVGYILTNICQEIKYDHRHNKNIRFLLKSELISPLFKDFLENSEDYWFSNSSLLNPGPCRQMVSLLIKISQSDQLIDVIQEYEK